MNDAYRMILLRWEKWRIAYNLILLVEGLWLLREHLVAAFAGFFWPFMVFFAVGANVCYFCGPLLEIYVHALLDSNTARTRYHPLLAYLFYFLFAIGLLLSMWLDYMWAIRGLGKL